MIRAGLLSIAILMLIGMTAIAQPPSSTAPPGGPPRPPMPGDPNLPPGPPPWNPSEIGKFPGSATLSPAVAKKLIKDQKDLLPALLEAMGDEDEEVRKLAGETMLLLGSEAVPHLIKALNDPKKSLLRASAANVLGQLGLTAKDALPDLIDAIKNSGGDVRKAALKAVKEISAQLDWAEQGRPPIPGGPAPLPGSGTGPGPLPGPGETGVPPERGPAKPPFNPGVKPLPPPKPVPTDPIDER